MEGAGRIHNYYYIGEKACLVNFFVEQTGLSCCERLVLTQFNIFRAPQAFVARVYPKS